MEIVVRENKRGLIKNKDFMLLIAGQIVSNIGNSVHSAAVSWFIMELMGEKNAGSFIAIFSACTLIPYIFFGPISGVFVDKMNRKKIIVGTDFIRGTLILILAVFTWFKIVPVVALFVITILSAFFGTLFNPAVSATIPNVVEEENLTKANSISGISTQMTFIIGAAISGFLYHYIGIIGVFVVNGISFILSGVAGLFINIPPTQRSENTTKEMSFWKDFSGGIKFIMNQRVLMVMFGFVLFFNFLFNPIFQIVFPKTVKFTLGMGPEKFGILEALFSGGAVIGMLALSLLPKREKSYRLIMTMLIIQCTIFIMYGIPIIPSIQSKIGNLSAYLIFCVLAFTMSIANALINVPIFTIFQKIVPDEYRGRFFGLLNTLCQGIVPLGLGVVGVISGVVPPYLLFIIAGLLSTALSIFMAFVPELKEL